MIWLIGSLLYGAIGVVTARLVAGHLAYMMMRNWNAEHEDLIKSRYSSYFFKTRPNGEQWSGAILGGFCAGIIWPIIIIAMLAGKTMPAVGAERMHQIELREERLRQAERELDLPKWQ